MTIEKMKQCVAQLLTDYPISRVTLFGSRAAGTNREDSDVDLIVEFSVPVSLLQISMLRCRLEELIGLPVDLIHGPIQADDMIEVGKAVELYAA